MLQFKIIILIMHSNDTLIAVYSIMHYGVCCHYNILIMYDRFLNVRPLFKQWLRRD